jgi:hypothetical protein
MRRAVLAALFLALAACAGGPEPMAAPQLAGGNRADGVVGMSSTVSIFSAARPDWSEAETGAARRCRAWGHDGARAFSGWREACRLYDRHGRCVVSRVTRFYTCEGAPAL